MQRSNAANKAAGSSAARQPTPPTESRRAVSPAYSDETGGISLEMQFRSAHRHFMKAIIPFIPFTADLKNGREESVN
jgi:hypothetical protein